MNIPSRKSFVAALLAAVAFGPALAGGGHGHGRGHDGERHGRGHDDEVRVIDQRVVIAEPRHVRRACPPGLVPSHDRCIPRGHAKRVVVGQALPPDAVFVVPRRVRTTLPPPPAGYRYAVVNNQVVLVSSGNLVVDIVRTLVG